MMTIRYRQATGESRIQADIHPLLKRLLSHRGVLDDESLSFDLAGLEDPFRIKDMPVAVTRLFHALKNNERICIVGDFDADGATSTALMMLGLKDMGFDHLQFMVPNRFEYGYGLSGKIIDELVWQKPDLLITVDNGISSVSGVEHANKLGMDVIITDHHLPGETLPAAAAILNPNRKDCSFPAKSLAGVGVAFHLLMALRKYLRDENWFQQAGIEEPNLAKYLDLVALGTVADLVPLDHYNRTLVAQGIKRIRHGRCRAGILALLQLAGKDYRYVSSVDLGFTVAPRLNAAGRLDDISQGIMLLMTDSGALANELAHMLDDLNKDRRLIEKQMQSEASQIVETMALELEQVPYGICLYHQDWHQGIVGLVASRIKDRFHRPVVAFAPADSSNPEELKGSCRSIKGIHMRDLLDEIATKNPGLIEKFGGHAMAAGLSLDKASLDRFKRCFEDALAAIDDRSLFDPVIESDGSIEPDDMNLYTAEIIRDKMPWGQHFPEPVFDNHFLVMRQKIVGQDHLKMTLAYPESGESIEAIWFNFDKSLWPVEDNTLVHVVYRLSINYYRGEQNLQLMVDEIQVLTEQ